jgi:hypothetical protein
MGRDRGRVIAQADNMVKKGLCPVSFDHPGVTSFQGASDVYKGPSVSFFVFVVNAERDQAQLLVCHLHHA